jgi:hypothetical protein
MKYQDAVVALHDNHKLFTFAAVRPFCTNDFGDDLMSNFAGELAYDFDGEAVEAYRYLASGAENNQYRDFGRTRQFAALVRKVLAANGIVTAKRSDLSVFI